MTLNKELEQAQKDLLLKTAREAIELYLLKGKTLELHIEDDLLNEPRGAFVTLKKEGKLRGCIGLPLPAKPLLETIIEMAIAAATKDYRFQSIRLKEFPHTKIEISVLSIPKEINNVSEIKVGTHGLILSRGISKGLLLPQVPLEYDWDLETYLRHASLKAGLAEDAWKKGAKIEVFSAQVFSE